MQSYDVKIVSGVERTYIWGSEGVGIALADSDVLLHFRVDDFGEEIAIGWRNDTSSPFKDLGKMKPGESFTIPLKGLRGVYAKCVQSTSDTKVTVCLLCPGA